MQKFLHKVATHLLKKHGNNMSRLTVLMPNHRMCVFFREALMESAAESVWLPEIITLQDWIFNKSDLALAQPLELVLELYEVFKENGGEEPIDEFIPVAQVMIEDFSEVDRQLTDAAPFFGYLEKLQSMKVWVPGEEPDEYAVQYRKFWHLFRVTYFAFREKLLAKNKSYEGLIYCTFASQMQRLQLDKDWKVAAVGFNYLTKSEEKILQYLGKNCAMESIWDTDRYYVEDNYQEAGMFFRKYIREWRIDNEKWQEDLVGTEEKQINIIGVAKNIGQTKVVADILSNKLELNTANERNTVIVLPDESLLNPLLVSLPGNISAYNISMGYPLRESLPAGLLKLLFALHDGVEKKQSNNRRGGRFHYLNIFDILHHPYTSILIEDKAAISNFMEFVKRRNQHRVGLSEIGKVFSGKDYAKLFWYTDDAKVYLQKLIELIDDLRLKLSELTKNGGEDRSVDIELLFFLYKTIQNIQNTMTNNKEELSVQSLRKLLTESIRFARVPFEGEPVKGLQIMGVMETRGLDFENVIILNMNEGVFPSGKKHNSYIPMEMKREFLSTYKEKDAESAYLFLRLLQRAKATYLLYNTESDELGGGEKSRFILQLQYELQKANRKAVISDLVYSVDPPPRMPEDDLVIYKDEKLQEKLFSDLRDIGISPSALNTYINCSLQYYLRYTANLREQDDVEESIEAATLGSAVHDVLENLYKEKLEQPLTAEFLSTILGDKNRRETLTKEAFEDRFDEESLKHGKNYLLYRVCLKLLDEFLKHEKKHLELLKARGEELRIMMLEQKMEQKISIAGREVKVYGKVDRVEETAGTISVADYKTGTPAGSVIKSDDVGLFAGDPKYAKAMQLLTYAWLYWRGTGSGDIRLRSGIYWLRQISDGLDALTVDKSTLINRDILFQFEEVLKNVLTSLLDRATPFQKTTDTARCRNCEFIRICRRE